MEKMKIFLAITTSVLLLGGTPASASGVAPPPPDVEVQVVQESGVNVLTAFGSEKDAMKRHVERALRRSEQLERLRSTETGDYVQDLYYSGEGATAWSGSRVRTWYDDTHARVDWANCGGWCITAYIDGFTKTAWFGWDPFYSDAIQLTERWKFRGLGVSASISGGGVSAGFSSAGDEVSFNSGWVDTGGWAWRLQNKYSGVRGKTYVTMWGVDDTATGSHRFGYQIVTATANGGITWHPPDY